MFVLTGDPLCGNVLFQASQVVNKEKSHHLTLSTYYIHSSYHKNDIYKPSNYKKSICQKLALQFVITKIDPIAGD